MHRGSHIKRIEFTFVIVGLIIVGKLLPPESYDYFIMAFACVIGVFWLGQPTKINKTLFVGYYLRLLLAFVAHFDIYPIEGRRSDALVFVEQAERILAPSISEMWLNYTADPIDFYPMLIALVYFIFGQSNFLVTLINVVLSTLVIRNVYLFTEKVHSEVFGQAASKIVSVLPYAIMFGVTIIREAFLTFFLTYCFVIIAKNRITGTSLLQLLGSIVMLVMLHGGFVFFMIAVMIYFVVALFISKSSLLQRFAIIAVSVTIIITGYFVLINFNVYKIGTINPEASSTLVLDRLFNSAGYVIEGSNYRQAVAVTGIGDIFANFGTVVIPFIFQPYIWRLIELKTYILIFLGSIPWHILAALCLFHFRSFVCVVKLNIKYFFLIGSTAVIFAFGSSQLNQAVRHNHKFLPLIVGLMCPVIVRNKYISRMLSFTEQAKEHGD